MASLQSYVNMLPRAYQGLFSSSGHFLLWGKELLEEIQERGFLSDLKKETGCVVLKDRWIDKPANFLGLVKICNPEDEKQEYRVEEVEDKFKLQDWEVGEESGSVNTDTYDTYATTGLRCTDLVDATLYPADYFKGYLFFIESGTLANTGFIVYSNTVASAAGVPLTFLHTQSSALSGTKVTGARLIPPQYYVMMKYRGTITVPTALGDEFPIPADCEIRLVPAWLRWCCERQAMSTSKETSYWEAQKEKILNDIQFSRSGRLISPARGRRLAGFEKGYSIGKKHPDFSEFL